MSLGNFFLKYWSGPSSHPPLRGTALKTLGSLLVALSSTTDTSGIPGLAFNTRPPKLSWSENPPTRAKSLFRAFWVACLLPAPLKPSSAELTMILRPLIPPMELT